MKLRSENSLINSDFNLKHQIKDNIRNTSLDFLRIIAMLLIITLHYLSHGGVLETVVPFSLNYYVAWIFDSLAYVAINIYVLISGYFLVFSTFNLKKLFRLVMEIWFYSIAIYIILSASGIIDFDIKSFIYSLIPISTKGYWFATIYIALYVVSPILNKSIQNMSREQLRNSILVLVFLFSILSNVFYFIDPFNVNGGNGLIWFVTLYMISSYLRLYYKPKVYKSKWIFRYLILSLLLTASRSLIEYITINFGLVGSPIRPVLFFSNNSILVALASVYLFIFFLNVRIENIIAIKIINYFAPLTFGVYLIHDNSHIRLLIWNVLVQPFNYSRVWILPIHLIVSVIIIFIVCSLVESIRMIIFKLFNNFDWLYNKGNDIFNVIRQKFPFHLNK